MTTNTECDETEFDLIGVKTMKKLKQFLTLLFALLLLTGCAVTPKETDASETEQTGTSGIQKPTTPDHPFPTMPEPTTVLYQALPETVDNPDNLPVLKWVCLVDTYGGWNRTWSEDAVIELNQMLADRKMPFRLQLHISS